MKPGPLYVEHSEPTTRINASPFGYQPRRGLSIPAITVLDASGRVIEEDQRHLFRHLAQQGRGADILFAVGTTGEWNRIDNSERQRLIWIETSEVARINSDASTRERQPVEAWVGVTAPTAKETLSNLECALEAHADAAVIAPLSIASLGDIVSFFQRDISDLFDHRGRWLPIFLYDGVHFTAEGAFTHENLKLPLTMLKSFLHTCGLDALNDRLSHWRG